MGLITQTQVSMAQISWIGRLLGESDGVITHVKFLTKVATLSSRDKARSFPQTVIQFPSSERSPRQRNRTSKDSVAAVWKSKVTLYFFITFEILCGSLCVQCMSWLIGSLDTSISVMISPVTDQKTTYFVLVLESWLFGGMRFSSGSDLRHGK